MFSENKNEYVGIIEDIFLARYRTGISEIPFTNSEVRIAGKRRGIDIPDVSALIYSFRHRKDFPRTINKTASRGWEWFLKPASANRYKFKLAKSLFLSPHPHWAETRIFDVTPELVLRYSLDDAQSTLAKIRFNRLIDLFTGITCYPLQSHLRTKIDEIGQTETDDVYVGLDRRGVHYVLPVQAKGKGDRLGIIQIEQDIAMSQLKFASLVCKPIAAQSMKNGAIALFEFESGADGIRLYSEKHYRLVPSSELSIEELEEYRRRTE